MAKKDVFHYYAARPGKTAENVVFSPFPFGGNRYNSDERLQALATQSGFDVVTAHAAGTGTVFVDRATRKTIRGHLKTVVQRQGEALHNDPRYQAYPGYRVGQGVSARSIWMAEMAYWMYESDVNVFTHVQTCDGINFAAPENRLTGLRRVQRKGSERSEAIPPVFEPQKNIIKNIHVALCSMGEARAYAHTMCRTKDSQFAPMLLAGAASVPYHSILLEDGIGGGTIAQMDAFGRELERLRAAYGRYGDEPAPLKAEILPYKHGDLMDPGLGAMLLERTVQLTDPEFKIA